MTIKIIKSYKNKKIWRSSLWQIVEVLITNEVYYLMPKFNEQEFEVIKNKLLVEGEKLFEAHGLKKVTIDDLTQAAGISHGAFYTFFKNKEHLFMEISIMRQRKIFNHLDSLIDKNKNRQSRELAKRVLEFLRIEYFEDPMISSINGTLWEQIIRRIPQETAEANILNDAIVVEKLTDVGMKFKYQTSLVVKTVQAVFMAINAMAGDEERDEIANLLFEAVIDKIVEEKEDEV